MMTTAHRTPNLDQALERLTHQSRRVSYNRGDLIIREGDKTDTFYLLLAGRVKVFVSDADGKELWLAEYVKGDFIGELALDKAPRTASVAALEDGTQCAVLTSDTLLELIKTQPDAALDLIKALIGRARVATTLAKSVALDLAANRIRAYLVQIAVKVDGQMVIRPKPNFQTMGDKLGCSRDMVSKVIKGLRADGTVIESESGFIIVD